MQLVGDEVKTSFLLIRIVAGSNSYRNLKSLKEGLDVVTCNDRVCSEKGEGLMRSRV